MKFILLFICVNIFLCKLVSGQFNEKIIGGTLTVIKNFPYLVSIQIPGLYKRQHICGGAILSSKWILTAAHCLKHYEQAEAYTVRLGSTKNDYSETATDHGIIDKFIHPRYIINGDQQFEYDIALLKVATPIIFSDRIQPIQLASLNEKYTHGELGIIAGWGDPTSPFTTNILEKVALKIIDNDICQSKHELPITKNMLCVSPISTTPAGMCLGDSGGPFVINHKVVGISAWGIGCGLVDSPGVLTRVSTFIKWVNYVTGL